MTNGNGTVAPSGIKGDSYDYPSFGGIPLALAIPFLMSPPTYSDLPPYWSWHRDVALVATVHKEDMWAAAVARTATKFAAHGYTIKDSRDSKLRVKNSLALMKQADGGQGWVTFAEKVMQDLLTTDNGIFIRIRRANDETVPLRLKAYDAEQGFSEVRVTRSSPGAKIEGLYHLDSLRCRRTGNLMYPIRYQPMFGSPQLLKWDQVLSYADMPAPRAELFGVGFCAASRAYKTISLLAAMQQMIYEFVAGKGATKLAFLQGLSEPTLKGVIRAGENDAQAKGLIYYLGTILGAIPSDTPISLIEVLLKQLPQGFDPKQIQDNAYLVYANAIGVAVQDIQPLSGQGLGTGAQTIILAEQSRGIGIAAFLKWWEQTVSDRVLPATTELSFEDEHDMRDQQDRANVALARANERNVRILNGELTVPMAQQMAADAGDLPQELLTAADMTPGGQISDDEKVAAQEPGPVPLLTTAPAPQAAQPTVGAKSDVLFEEELRIARSLARWAE